MIGGFHTGPGDAVTLDDADPPRLPARIRF